MSNMAGTITMPGSDTDSALVSLSQKGDLSAFETLVVRHQKRMLNISFRLLGNYEDACEIVQDAFVSAYKNIRSFRGDAKFTTWLTAITLNLSRNRLKKMKAQQGHASYCFDDPAWAEDCDPVSNVPDGRPSALDRLEKNDLRQGVQNCIRDLDPDYREVIILRDLQDFSYGEIEGMLNLREGTVKSRLSRAREAIRKCLKKIMGAL